MDHITGSRAGGESPNETVLMKDISSRCHDQGITRYAPTRFSSQSSDGSASSSIKATISPAALSIPIPADRQGSSRIASSRGGPHPGAIARYPVSAFHNVSWIDRSRSGNQARRCRRGYRVGERPTTSTRSRDSGPLAAKRSGPASDRRGCFAPIVSAGTYGHSLERRPCPQNFARGDRWSTQRIRFGFTSSTCGVYSGRNS